MLKALIFKEWIKTRAAFFISLALAVASMTYAVLMMMRLVELKGVEHLWLIMLMKDNLFVDAIKYIPVVAGIAVGVAQMTPEMSHKRLKLTLHLPYPMTRLVTVMLLCGLMELLVIYIIQLLGLVIYYNSILPSELTFRMILTTLPWFLAGFSAYLFVASVCLEGTKYMRILLGLLGIAVISFFYLQPAPEAFNGILPIAVIFTFMLMILSIGSVIRFKEGRQD